LTTGGVVRLLQTRKEPFMYIGLGTLLVIIILILLFA
jgi:hypothetical protein